MVLSIKNSSLRQQLTEIKINDRRGGGDGTPIILPYDPNNAPDNTNTTVVVASNYVDNSDFDFSKNGYIASGAGDADFECYNFYRQRFIKLTDVVTTSASNAITSAVGKFKNTYTYPMEFVLLNGGASGQAISGYINRNASDTSALLYSDVAMTTPLNVSNTLTDAVLWFGESLTETAAKALKYTGHSLYAANEGALDIIPRWDRTKGWGEFGSDIAADSWDIATPLPLNFIRAGVTYYFRILISQRSGATAGGPVRVYFGLFDNTTGQKRFLESSNLDLTVTPVGTAGSTTYKYRIIADLDDGTEITSDLVTITNGNAALSTSNYNRLTWENAAGILNYRIFREAAGVVKRVFTIRNGSHDYNDYGTDEGETPPSMPSASVLRPVAYKVSPEFTLSGTGIWHSFLLSLEIPSTYDSSVTTGKQWLRFGIEGLAGQERVFVFDRVMLSTSNGGWQRSARDLNKILSQSPTSLPGDDGGQGGGGIGGCFVMETPILVCAKDGSNLTEIPIGTPQDELTGQYLFVGNRVNRIKAVSDSYTDFIVRCTLRSGVTFDCSPSERFITSVLDKHGTRIDALTLGDEISHWARRRKRQFDIVGYRIIKQRTLVRTLHLVSGKTFCVGRLMGIRGLWERFGNRIRNKIGLPLRFTKAIAHNQKAGGGEILS